MSWNIEGVCTRDIEGVYGPIRYVDRDTLKEQALRAAEEIRRKMMS